MMKWDNYESPVQIISKQIQLQQEEQIMKAIQEVGVVVDKEELIRCMQYDRDQYSKGYEQGREDVLNTLKKLINSDYNSRECHLLYSDLCEFLEEKNNDERPHGNT